MLCSLFPDDKTNCIIPPNIVNNTITANDLIIALNEAFHLEMDVNNIFNCYLVAENPIAFLHGNKELSEFGIRNGTKIIFKRG